MVGGGVSGSAAAIASARLHVDTLVIERYGFLGGNATATMVEPFGDNRGGNSDDLVKGVFHDMLVGLQAMGAFKRDPNKPGVIYFDAEALKYVLNNLVTGSGAKMMLMTWAEKPLVKGNIIEGVIVNNKSGRLAVMAQVVIDGTGDGDIAAAAGCQYEMGRGYDQYTQSATMYFRMGNVDTVKAFAEQSRRAQKGPGGSVPPTYLFADLFKKAVAEGRFPADIPINEIYFEMTMQPDVVSINATRVFEIDGTNSGDVTYASVETRRQAVELSEFLKG